jgi:hypothetical protein
VSHLLHALVQRTGRGRTAALTPSRPVVDTFAPSLSAFVLGRGPVQVPHGRWATDANAFMQGARAGSLIGFVKSNPLHSGSRACTATRDPSPGRWIDRACPRCRQLAAGLSLQSTAVSRMLASASRALMLCWAALAPIGQCHCSQTRSCSLWQSADSGRRPRAQRPSSGRSHVDWALHRF